MKFFLYKIFAVLIACLTVSAGTAYADVKIKSRQTTGGQAVENTVLIKGKRQRTEMMNGAMISVMQCDMRRDLQINPQGQTYQISPFDDGSTTMGETAETKNVPITKGGTVTTLVTTKDTGERKQMFGYTAKHIITTMETNSSPEACSLNKSRMEFDGWYIDAEFALECANNRYANPGSTTGGCRDKYEMKTVGAAKKGYPVLEKMTIYDDKGKPTMTMETEVVELSKATLDAQLFDIPAGYREVKDASELYTAGIKNGGANGGSSSPDFSGGDDNSSGNSGMSQTVKNMSQGKSNAPAEVGAKKEGTIRIGLPTVKTGSVGEGINPQELAAAIQNSLGEYLKGSKVELVPLETKLASAIETEAKEKECDFVLYATVSHKKGGGGFGMFKAIAPVLASTIPMAGMGAGMAGAVAGSVASTAITSASATQNVKSKDELTLEVKLQKGSTVALNKQFKAKAKSQGEDIISPVVEQLAQAIVDTAAK